jgi:O-antigen ligase
LKSPALLVLTAVFFLYLITGLYSSDTTFWLAKMRAKLPFLILPFAFAAVKPFSQITYRNLLYTFFLLISITSIFIFIQFWVQKGDINYDEGQVLETPFSHIRFSLMVAFGVAIGIYSLAKRHFFKYKNERYLQLFLILFLIVFAHVMAVRSGLLALYLVVLYFFVHYLIVGKNWKVGIASILLFFTFVMIAYNTFPTLKEKVGYMKYSLDLYFKGEVREDLSDAQRIGSILAGMEAGKKNRLIGVGAGDIELAMHEVYITKYPKLAAANPLPHNQFVYVYVALGIVGLLIFTGCLLFPFFYKKAFKHPPLFALYIIVFSSFMTEHTLETQIGTGFFLLFLLLALCYNSGKGNRVIKTVTTKA